MSFSILCLVRERGIYREPLEKTLGSTCTVAAICSDDAPPILALYPTLHSSAPPDAHLPYVELFNQFLSSAIFRIRIQEGPRGGCDGSTVAVATVQKTADRLGTRRRWPAVTLQKLRGMARSPLRLRPACTGSKCRACGHSVPPPTSMTETQRQVQTGREKAKPGRRSSSRARF